MVKDSRTLMPSLRDLARYRRIEEEHAVIAGREHRAFAAPCASNRSRPVLSSRGSLLTAKSPRHARPVFRRRPMTSGTICVNIGSDSPLKLWEASPSRRAKVANIKQNHDRMVWAEANTKWQVEN
jgi:hypothetical protein